MPRTASLAAAYAPKRACPPVPDPDPDRWEEQLKEVARTMRAAILGHRDVVRLSIGRVPLGPHALRYADRVLAILRAGELPDELAVAGLQLLMSIVIGFAIDETGEGGVPPAGQPPPQEDAGAMLGEYLESLRVQTGIDDVGGTVGNVAAGNTDDLCARMGRGGVAAAQIIRRDRPVESPMRERGIEVGRQPVIQAIGIAPLDAPAGRGATGRGHPGVAVEHQLGLQFQFEDVQ